MDSELYKKMNELFALLDNLDCIKNIIEIKNNVSSDLIKMINEYREMPTIQNKKRLYENETFLEYIKNETELNYLIMAINNKFQRKRGQCESN